VISSYICHSNLQHELAMACGLNSEAISLSADKLLSISGGAGHVARMPMSRAPRQLLTGWVSHSRPIGCPQMTWGRTLENALKSKGISKDLDEWIAIAKDRSKWRQLTHSIPKPPDA